MMDLTLVAEDESIALIGWHTSAEFLVFSGLTPGVGDAGTISAAQKLAALRCIVTPLPLVTVVVAETADVHTSNQGIALKARGAEASSLVEFHLASCSISTGDHLTWIHALLTIAGLGVRAVVVFEAFI